MSDEQVTSTLSPTSSNNTTMLHKKTHRSIDASRHLTPISQTPHKSGLCYEDDTPPTVSVPYLQSSPMSAYTSIDSSLEPAPFAKNEQASSQHIYRPKSQAHQTYISVLQRYIVIRSISISWYLIVIVSANITKMQKRRRDNTHTNTNNRRRCWNTVIKPTHSKQRARYRCQYHTQQTNSIKFRSPRPTYLPPSSKPKHGTKNLLQHSSTQYSHSTHTLLWAPLSLVNRHRVW